MRSSILVIAAFLPLCALATCSVEPAVDSSEAQARRVRYKDAGAPAVDAPPAVDAAPTSSGGTGSVSCYSEYDPAATCALPVHCCFSNYSAQHDGTCTTASCAYGTIACDGPEDCAGGDRCCSRAIVDPDNGITGYVLACQAGACDGPYGDELCHPDGPACANGGTCVSAYGANYDLPRTLYVCR